MQRETAAFGPLFVFAQDASSDKLYVVDCTEPAHERFHYRYRNLVERFLNKLK
jgi:hypothetical protein